MSAEPVRLVSPLLDRPGAAPALAPRLASLDGAVLGLLANGKANGDRLLDLVAEELGRRHAVAGVVRVAKTHPSLPPPEEDVAMLAEHALAVLSAIGD